MADGNTVHLTWDTPVGEHGGILEAEGLQYTLGRQVNGGDTEVLAVSFEGNSYDDTYDTDTQVPIVYLLMAANNIGKSRTAVSNTVIVGGDAYPLPFNETFPSGFATYDIWQVTNLAEGVAYWRMWNIEDDPTITPYDNDLGALCFFPVVADTKARLSSGCIDLGASRHPVLEFHYRGLNSAGQRIIVEGCDNGSEWSQIGEITLSDASNEWATVKIPLNKFNLAKRFQIAFVGEAAAGTAPIYIDGISIREVYDYDLDVKLVNRKNFNYGEPQEVKAVITNCGEKQAAAYAVEFYADDALLATADMPALEVDATAEASFTHDINLGYNDNSTLKARIVYERDQNLDNNIATSDVRNHLPLYPAPRNLIAKGEPSALSLAWEEPEAWTEPEQEPVTDDFESYQPFLIDEIGDWTTVDQDGEDGTFGLIGLHFPYREAPKSWQLFNLWALGIEMADDEVTWRPSSGHQFLVSFADKDRQNDDWLISPVLPGKAQTISFMTRSLNTFWYGEEEFEVYASSTGKELSDFKLIYSGTAPNEWTKTEVDLPDGTRYFAIKCVSGHSGSYKFAMGLDDITYTPGTGMPEEFEFAGYNLYHNDKKVNASLLTEREAQHSGAVGSSYAVTAVYTTGESRYSNVVSTSGISSATLAEGVSVAVDGRDIIVSGAEGMNVAIYTIDGLTCLSTKAANSVITYHAAPAVYLVKVGGATAKVIVR